MEERYNRDVQAAFDIWILSKKSIATQSSYKRVVPQFFKYISNKSLENIDSYDMYNIVPMTVQEKYINRLVDEGVKQSTIKNYLAVVSSFIEYLSSNNVFDVNYKFITDVALSGNSLKNDSGRRELMPEQEYERFKEWLLNRPFSKRYGDLGKKYALALEVMYSTAIRIDAAFTKITWADIKWETDLLGNEGWTIYVTDKGDKLNRKPINERLYDKLRNVFYKGNENDLVMGSISKQSFTRLMKEYSEEYKVKMTPHSIKVGAGTKLYSMTKDIVLTSRFLDHSDTKTTERYIRTDDDRTNTGSYIMTTEIDECQLDCLSFNELHDILNSRKDLKRAVLLEAKKQNLI